MSARSFDVAICYTGEDRPYRGGILHCARVGPMYLESDAAHRVCKKACDQRPCAYVVQVRRLFNPQRPEDRAERADLLAQLAALPNGVRS